MGEVYMGKLILTARGLNSETGQKIIRKCLTEEEEREKKTILLISIQEYRMITGNRLRFLCFFPFYCKFFLSGENGSSFLLRIAEEMRIG